MNAIQIKSKIDFYNNEAQIARFYNFEYDDVNIAMLQYLNERLGDQSIRTPEDVSTNKDDIYTLVKTASANIFRWVQH